MITIRLTVKQTPINTQHATRRCKQHIKHRP